VIKNEKGEYYTDFEWVGTAQLLGILAGSGDTRNISEFREFTLELQEIVNNNNMTEEQITALLEEQKATFEAEIESIKKEFKIVSQSASASAGVYEWTDEKGNKYQETYESMYKSITELVEEKKEDAMVAAFLKSKGITLVFSDEVKDTTEETKDETDETTEELQKQVDNAIAEDMQSKSKKFSKVESKFEVVGDPTDTPAPVKFNLEKEIQKLNPQLNN
jgi:hypothetical protein